MITTKAKGILKNIVTLLSGTSLSQIIVVVTLPIIAYYYTPQQIGVYSLVLAMVSLYVVIATLKYEMAILLPKSNYKGIIVFYISTLSTLFFSLLAFLLIIVISILQRNLLISIPFEFEKWKYVIPFLIFCMGATNSLNYFTNRNSNFKALAFSRVLNSSLYAISSILLHNLGSIGLVTGYSIGFLCSVVILVIANFSYFKKVKLKHIYATAKEYKDFPIKNVSSSFMNIGSSQFPVLLMGYYFGAQVTGYFSLSMRLLNAPMSFIGKAFSQVYFNFMSKSNPSERPKLFTKTTKILFIFVTPIMAMLFLFSDLIFLNFFGDEWLYSSFITKVLIPFYLVRFIFSSQSTLITINRSLGFELIFNAINLLLQVAAVVIAFYGFHNYNYVFYFMSIGGTLLYIFLGWKLFILSKIGCDYNHEKDR